jgi:hypothetical protein
VLAIKRGEGTAIFGERKRKGGEAEEDELQPPTKYQINAEENLL